MHLEIFLRSRTNTSGIKTERFFFVPMTIIVASEQGMKKPS